LIGSDCIACRQWQQLQPYVKALGLNAAYLDPRHNKCYCAECEAAAEAKVKAKFKAETKTKTKTEAEVEDDDKEEDEKAVKSAAAATASASIALSSAAIGSRLKFRACKTTGAVEKGKGQKQCSRPVGWSRLGVRVHPKHSAANGELRVFEEWWQCYHGTGHSELQATRALLSSILAGSLLLPGNMRRLCET
jgi:hypothetical protein